LRILIGFGALNMSLESKLTAASTREPYVTVLKVTLTELTTALCRLAHDEASSLPFVIKFKDQHPVPWHRRIAELPIDGTKEWITEPEAPHLDLPITGYYGHAYQCGGRHGYVGNARISSRQRKDAKQDSRRCVRKW
jgi:hypothetical protein